MRQVRGRIRLRAPPRRLCAVSPCAAPKGSKFASNFKYATGGKKLGGLGAACFPKDAKEPVALPGLLDRLRGLKQTDTLRAGTSCRPAAPRRRCRAAGPPRSGVRPGNRAGVARNSTCTGDASGRSPSSWTLCSAPRSAASSPATPTCTCQNLTPRGGRRVPAADPRRRRPQGDVHLLPGTGQGRRDLHHQPLPRRRPEAVRRDRRAVQQRRGAPPQLQALRPGLRPRHVPGHQAAGASRSASGRASPAAATTTGRCGPASTTPASRAARSSGATTPTATRTCPAPWPAGSTPSTSSTAAARGTLRGATITATSTSACACRSAPAPTGSCTTSPASTPRCRAS